MSSASTSSVAGAKVPTTRWGETMRHWKAKCPSRSMEMPVLPLRSVVFNEFPVCAASYQESLIEEATSELPHFLN
ncbi:hypothetical protein DMENIID0001_098160 [Sergentomyia squamirostris]